MKDNDSGMMMCDGFAHRGGVGMGGGGGTANG